jgi:hypothetical protein
VSTEYSPSQMYQPCTAGWLDTIAAQITTEQSTPHARKTKTKSLES